MECHRSIWIPIFETHQPHAHLDTLLQAVKHTELRILEKDKVTLISMSINVSVMALLAVVCACKKAGKRRLLLAPAAVELAAVQADMLCA